MGEILDSDWSRSNLLRSDWLLLIVASMTTPVPQVRRVAVIHRFDCSLMLSLEVDYTRGLKRLTCVTHQIR